MRPRGAGDARVWTGVCETPHARDRRHASLARERYERCAHMTCASGVMWLRVEVGGRGRCGVLIWHLVGESDMRACWLLHAWAVL